MSHDVMDDCPENSDALPLVKRFGLSIGSGISAYAFLANMRAPYLLSLGFDKAQQSQIRALGILCTLLINTPFSAYADRFNRAIIFKIGGILQLISPLLYLLAAELFASPPGHWGSLVVGYALLELGKYATHDSLASFSILLFLDQAKPQRYRRYICLVQRHILFFSCLTTCAVYIELKLFGCYACFFTACALFAFARIILRPSMIATALRSRQKFPGPKNTTPQEKASPCPGKMESPLSALLQPVLKSLRSLARQPWGICALLSTGCFGVLREYVVHLWAITLFGDSLKDKNNLPWPVIIMLLCINLGFMVSSLSLIKLFEFLDQKQKTVHGGPPLCILGIGALGALLVGLSAGKTLWLLILQAIGLCACFGAQEVAQTISHQLFARCAPPEQFNSMQNLSRGFMHLCAILFLQFLAFFPDRQNTELFQVIACLFLLLWIIMFFWKKAIRTLIPHH